MADDLPRVAGLIRSSAHDLCVLQIGLEWFANGAGGGASRVMAELVRNLPEVGVAVRGAVAGPPDVAELTNGFIESFDSHNGGIARRLLRVRGVVRRQLQDNQINVAAGHFALYVLPWLDRLGQVPLVMHFHGPWAAESEREGAARPVVLAKRALERLVYSRAARVIVLSHAFAALAERDYRIPAARLRVVPGCADLQRFAVPETKAEARARLGWPIDRKVLLSVRRLNQRMGLDKLLEAMVQVVQTDPHVLLQIAGRGPQEAALRQLVIQNRLDHHVNFLGFLPDVDLPFAYRAADVNLVPTSELEGFGLTAAESLAAGTPSMVTPVGGLPEVVSALSTDMVFRSAAAADLALGLIRVLNGTVVLPDASACTAYASAKFGSRHMAAATAAIYREVCRQ